MGGCTTLGPLYPATTLKTETGIANCSEIMASCYYDCFCRINLLEWLKDLDSFVNQPVANRLITFSRAYVSVENSEAFGKRRNQTLSAAGPLLDQFTTSKNDSRFYQSISAKFGAVEQVETNKPKTPLSKNKTRRKKYSSENIKRIKG